MSESSRRLGCGSSSAGVERGCSTSRRSTTWTTSRGGRVRRTGSARRSTTTRTIAQSSPKGVIEDLRRLTLTESALPPPPSDAEFAAAVKLVRRDDTLGAAVAAGRPRAVSADPGPAPRRASDGRIRAPDRCRPVVTRAGRVTCDRRCRYCPPRDHPRRRRRRAGRPCRSPTVCAGCRSMPISRPRARARQGRYGSP